MFRDESKPSETGDVESDREPEEVGDTEQPEGFQVKVLARHAKCAEIIESRVVLCAIQETRNVLSHFGWQGIETRERPGGKRRHLADALR